MAHFLVRSKRPWRSRVWFYRPQWYFPSWKPVWFGNDEYHWKTIVFGYNITGQVVIATKPFGISDECYDEVYGFMCDFIEDAKSRGWEY